MDFMIVLAVFFLLLRALADIAPFIIAVAIFNASKEYVKRGLVQRNETPKPSRLKTILRAILYG